MPELPEVETVRRRLLTCLPGLLLRDVVVNDWTVSVQTEQELNARLAGRRVTGLRRRGKYLLVDVGPVEEQGGRASGGPASRPVRPAGSTAGPSVAVIHLRMTGQLVFRPEPGERPARFRWELEPATDAALPGRAPVRPPLGAGPGGRGRVLRRSRDGPGAVRTGVHRRSTCAARCRADARRSRRSCSTSGGSPAWATSTPTRRCSAPACTRCARRGAWGRVRRGACTRPSSRPCRPASTTRARASRASSTRPGSAAASRRSSTCTSAPASRAASAGRTVERVVVGGRGTHYCPRCQPRRGGMAPGSRRRLGETAPPRSAKPADWEAPGR